MREVKDTQESREPVDTAGEEQMRNEQIAEEEHHEERRDERNEENFVPLFEDAEAEQFRTHWLDIQSRFVDDPGSAVKDSDNLVADVIKNITRNFSDRRMSLENQWKSGENASTEDLRVALKRYRSFFNRLLSLES